MTKQEWEDLCNGCGACCALNGPEGKTQFACRSFDCSTNRCMNYENRLEAELCCVDIPPERVPHLHKAGQLPDSCSLVRYLQGKPQEPMVPAKLIPFMLMDADEQNRYVRACNEWKKSKVVNTG